MVLVVNLDVTKSDAYETEMRLPGAELRILDSCTPVILRCRLLLGLLAQCRRV